MEILKNNCTDILGYSRCWRSSTENSEIFLEPVIESPSNEVDLVMDFFLGFGTIVLFAKNEKKLKCYKLFADWMKDDRLYHYLSYRNPAMITAFSINTKFL